MRGDSLLGSWSRLEAPETSESEDLRLSSHTRQKEG